MTAAKHSEVDYSELELRALAHQMESRLHRSGFEPPKVMHVVINSRSIDFAAMTRESYLALLGLAHDRETRNEMKRWAFAAMYGGDIDAKVIIPLYLCKDLIDVQADGEKEA